MQSKNIDTWKYVHKYELLGHIKRLSRVSRGQTLLRFGRPAGRRTARSDKAHVIEFQGAVVHTAIHLQREILSSPGQAADESGRIMLGRVVGHFGLAPWHDLEWHAHSIGKTFQLSLHVGS